MTYIISKRDGPRREDVAAKDFLRKNRAKIDAIANHLTGGNWSELRNPAPPTEPLPSGKLYMTPAARPTEAEPYVRISINGRVVIADLASGRQLHFVGELRGDGQARHLALGTRENGMFGAMDSDLYGALADLEGMSVPDEAHEQRLEQIIADRLGFKAIGRSD